MERKEKMILWISMMISGTLFSLCFTASLHGLLSHQYHTLTYIPFLECVEGLFRNHRQFLLFLSFEGLLVMCSVLFLIQNSRAYQSDLQKVTEDIETPAAVGQYQHGSSRWLEEAEMDRSFRVFCLDPSSSMMDGLIRSGYDGLGFMGKINTQQQDDDIRTDVPVCADAVSMEDKKTGENRECTEEVGFEHTEYQIKGDRKEYPGQFTGPSGKEGPWDRESDPYCLLEEGGIVVGMKKVGRKEKIHYIADDTHTLTIGATRSGKTRTLVLQSICLTALSGESMVISDPKAEIHEYTAGLLEKLGYCIMCLDFKNPEKSGRYNLLQPVIDAVNRGNNEQAEMYAWDITNILVGDNTSNEKIWENGEKSTIAAAILCVVVDNARRPEYQNLTNVYWFLAEMCKPMGNKTPMQEYVKKLKQGHPARALLSISDVAPSRTKGSFYTSALTTLRLFTSRSIHSITSRSDWDIAGLGRRKQALFFILPDEKTTYYPIASLMISQLYELLVHQSDGRGGRLKNRVNFFMEEFGNFTKINDLTNKLTVAGGRGMRFHFFLQSFEQLTEKYSRETASIVKSNCQTWIYLQADDKETLTEICEKLGKYTTSAYQLTSQHGRYVNPSSSSSVSLVGRELLTTDEIRRVCRPYQIVISRTHPAMMVSPDLSKWYFNRMMGLGDKEHNRKVREERQQKRPVTSSTSGEIPLWNIWVYYMKDIQMQEVRQRKQGFPMQAGSLFSNQFMNQGGSADNSEED